MVAKEKEKTVTKMNINSMAIEALKLGSNGKTVEKYMYTSKQEQMCLSYKGRLNLVPLQQQQLASSDEANLTTMQAQKGRGKVVGNARDVVHKTAESAHFVQKQAQIWWLQKEKTTLHEKI